MFEQQKLFEKTLPVLPTVSQLVQPPTGVTFSYSITIDLHKAEGRGRKYQILSILKPIITESCALSQIDNVQLEQILPCPTFAP